MLQHCAEWPNPRVNRTRLHRLSDLLGLALCAVICGVNSWVAREPYGLAKQEWLSQWLSADKEIARHATFARVFALLEPQAFRACLQAVPSTLATQIETPLALDGKYRRHSVDTAAGHGPRVMLSAWANDQRLVLVSFPGDTTRNEIKAVAELLALLDS